jgi:hypothetical protein
MPTASPLGALAATVGDFGGAHADHSEIGDTTYNRAHDGVDAVGDFGGAYADRACIDDATGDGTPACGCAGAGGLRYEHTDANLAARHVRG